jgi:DMSO/TMAO reductase YedYZ molybdopterin-dependent catalytic subunit
MNTILQRRWSLLVSAALSMSLLFTSIAPLRGQAASAPAASANATAAALTVGGDVTKPLSLSIDDVKKMPRNTVHVKNEHADKDEVYEGVLLSAILRQAGAPQGGQIRGKAMATTVLAEGADGYQVVFSIEELDADFQEADVLVADTLDGAPLGDKLGPLRLIAPRDKRPARWVRMLRSIRVVKPSN